jgi:antitoxin component of RelBE/YafQ-DinJ toxin-antitoxin module
MKTKNPKDGLVTVRLDADTERNLSALCKSKKLTQSEAIRYSINSCSETNPLGLIADHLGQIEQRLTMTTTLSQLEKVAGQIADLATITNANADTMAALFQKILGRLR